MIERLAALCCRCELTIAEVPFPASNVDVARYFRAGLSVPWGDPWVKPAWSLEQLEQLEQHESEHDPHGRSIAVRVFRVLCEDVPPPMPAVRVEAPSHRPSLGGGDARSRRLALAARVRSEAARRFGR